MDAADFFCGVQPNSEYRNSYMRSQSDPDKRARAKGKQPRSKAKVPKCILSVKGSVSAKTERRLAQRQPSFKESVTAHFSTSCIAGQARARR